MRNDGTRYCRVCGFEPADPPWGLDGLSPTYEICPCCGVEYGNEDYTEAAASNYRDQWLANGAKWSDPRTPSDGLSAIARLGRIKSRPNN
ncbi:hypothetical protein GCM10009619_06140 [Williamsia maris]|uniref:GATA-type domain-containing protein n=1 Tax=Williamsia maris TaxID=72806 RepID=A0ABT1HCT8_9NOCA|nr:hypothetical protein [Williamsia maris]